MGTTKLEVVHIVHSADDINNEYRKVQENYLNTATNILNVGRMLIEKKDELGHGNFTPWVKAECDFTPQFAVGSQRAWKEVGGKLSLSDILDEQDAKEVFRLAWGHKEKDVIALKHTGDQESYTPQIYVEAARTVMGGIDLDPASNKMAQQVVQADNYFTATDDGLVQDWNGNVFLNPPYEAKLISAFVDKLITSYLSSDVKQAVLLTNNSADTQWFHSAAKASGIICFTEGRINFLKRDGSTSSPTNGQSFFYFGKKKSKFTKTFCDFGLIAEVL